MRNDLDFLFAYMDDLIVFSKNAQRSNVKQVLERFLAFWLMKRSVPLVAGQSIFWVTQLHQKESDVPKSRVETIANFPKPESKKGLKTPFHHLR